MASNNGDSNTNSEPLSNSEIILIGFNGDYIHMPLENRLDYTIHLGNRKINRGAAYGCLSESRHAQELKEYNPGSPRIKRLFRKYGKPHVLSNDELKRLQEAYEKAESILGLSE